ncbi:MAG: hypothetical protein FJ299_05560 [Planctomycetes bacterium]|nr:hypothetical protein [Planctomycetota bacterium]
MSPHPPLLPRLIPLLLAFMGFAVSSNLAAAAPAQESAAQAPRPLTDEEIRPKVLSWGDGQGANPGSAVRIKLPEAQRLPEDGDGTIEVSDSEVARWMLGAYGETLVRNYAFEIFLREREAKRLGVSVTPEQVRAEFDRLMKERVGGAFGGDVQGWIDEMNRTGRSMDGVFAQRSQEIYSELLGIAVAKVGRKVPEEYVVARWELLHGRLGLRHDLQMMFFQVVQRSAEAGPTAAADQKRYHEEAMAAGRARADAVRARLLAGEDFATLARKESDDYVREGTTIGTLADNRGSGGEQKGFVHYGWPPAFLDAVDAVPIGGLSEPVYANGGFWLVRRVQTRETPLESVRAEIERQLIEEGPTSYEVALIFDPLLAKAKIELSPSLLAPETEIESPNQAAVAFTVDGEPVPRHVYAKWLMRTRAEESVSAFVEHFLVERRAKLLGVEATAAEVRERSEEMLQIWLDAKFKGKRERLDAFLAESGRTIDSYLASMDVRMRIDVLIDKMLRLERKLSDEDVRRRWEEIYGPGGRSFDARMILVGAPEIATPKPDATAEDLQRAAQEAQGSMVRLAEDLVRRLRNGEDFGTLAQRYSKDEQTARRGGSLLGGRFRPDQWSESVSKVVIALTPGEISDPIPLVQGMAIFERGPDRYVPLDDVREDILRQLRDQRTSDVTCSYYRNELYKQSRVEILPAMNQ